MKMLQLLGLPAIWACLEWALAHRGSAGPTSSQHAGVAAHPQRSVDCDSTANCESRIYGHWNILEHP